MFFYKVSFKNVLLMTAIFTILVTSNFLHASLLLEQTVSEIAYNNLKVDVLSKWSIGDIEAIRLIKNGRWCVTTTSGKVYVLKDLGLDMKPKTKKLPWKLSSWEIDQLVYAVDLQNYLAKELNGLVPSFLVKDSIESEDIKNFYVKSGEGVYFLENFIIGNQERLRNAKPGILAEIGRVLARFHAATAIYVPKGKESQEGWSEFLYRQENVDTILAVVKDQYPQNTVFIQQTLQRFANAVSLDLYHSLPTAIIHGDTNISNFLFDEKGHITGIIDLLDSGRAPRIVDFTSILFKNIAGDNAYYNRENIEEFIKGYQTFAKQPLSQTELEALPYFLLLEPLTFFIRLHCFGPSKYGDDLYMRVIDYMKNVLNDIDNGFYQNIVDKYAEKSMIKQN